MLNGDARAQQQMLSWIERLAVPLVFGLAAPLSCGSGYDDAQRRQTPCHYERILQAKPSPVTTRLDDGAALYDPGKAAWGLRFRSNSMSPHKCPAQAVDAGKVRYFQPRPGVVARRLLRAVGSPVVRWPVPSMPPGCLPLMRINSPGLRPLSGTTAHTFSHLDCLIGSALPGKASGLSTRCNSSAVEEAG